MKERAENLEEVWGCGEREEKIFGPARVSRR